MMERGVKSIWRVTPSPPPEERERLVREHKAEVSCSLITAKWRVIPWCGCFAAAA